MGTVVYKAADPQLFSLLQQRESKQTVFITPTDTVYGFSCAYGQEAGTVRIQLLKQRKLKQFICLTRGLDDANSIASINAQQREILDHYWPGPITFVLNKKNDEGTIALRTPNHPLLIGLMNWLNEPMLSTSCNLFGEPPVTSITEAAKKFRHGVDFMIDGGESSETQASTIVDLTNPKGPKVLRSGPIAFNAP